ncbi:hypothetical protein HDF14_001623 [Edaphobacter lichenicola]|uniref:Uncharacterized protein n=1 Tax=Tunturiibacter gelidiferens TaxID=3069689 RepID=A0A9X0QCW6_9BACT|nr:hypothetical protein [Edaphobacter lichenicola]
MPGRTNAKLQFAPRGRRSLRDLYTGFVRGSIKLVVHSYEVSAVLQMLLEVG